MHTLVPWVVSNLPWNILIDSFPIWMTYGTDINVNILKCSQTRLFSKAKFSNFFKLVSNLSLLYDEFCKCLHFIHKFWYFSYSAINAIICAGFVVPISYFGHRDLTFKVLVNFSRWWHHRIQLWFLKQFWWISLWVFFIIISPCVAYLKKRESH